MSDYGCGLLLPHHVFLMYFKFSFPYSNQMKNLPLFFEVMISTDLMIHRGILEIVKRSLESCGIPWRSLKIFSTQVNANLRAGFAWKSEKETVLGKESSHTVLFWVARMILTGTKSFSVSDFLEFSQEGNQTIIPRSERRSSSFVWPPELRKHSESHSTKPLQLE